MSKGEEETSLCGWNMDSEIQEKQLVSHSVTKPLKFASKSLEWTALKKDEDVDDDEEDLDISISTASSDDDNECLGTKLDEPIVNSDEYMSNVSEEECAVFLCSECGKKFNNNVSLKAHLAKKHNPRALVNCELCDSKYRGDFIDHLLSEHRSIDSGFFCKKCDFLCKDQETIIKHRHDKNDFNVCKLCGKMYKSKENYKLHLLIHSNGDYKKKSKSTFSCEDCGKKFLLACFIKDHNSKLLAENFTAKCQMCSSSRNETVKNNSPKLGSEKPFKCSVCNRSFLRSIGLKKHMRSHNGDHNIR